MGLTGTYIQNRFIDLYTYLEGETTLIHDKLSTIDNNVDTILAAQSARRLDALGAPYRESAPDTNKTTANDDTSCNNFNIQVEIVSHDSPRSFLLLVTCDGVRIQPGSLALSSFDEYDGQAREINLTTFDTQWFGVGKAFIKIPDSFQAQHFFVEVSMSGNNDDKESSLDKAALSQSTLLAFNKEKPCPITS